MDYETSIETQTEFDHEVEIRLDIRDTDDYVEEYIYAVFDEGEQVSREIDGMINEDLVETFAEAYSKAKGKYQ